MCYRPELVVFAEKDGKTVLAIGYILTGLSIFLEKKKEINLLWLAVFCPNIFIREQAGARVYGGIPAVNRT